MDVRVLVTGDRNWTHYEVIERAITNMAKLHGEVLSICHGGARGADQIAGDVCEVHDIPCKEYRADWEKYGRAAGPVRNQEMLDEFKPDVVMAFHDNLPESRGTLDMVTRAKNQGIWVYLFNSKGEMVIWK